MYEPTEDDVRWASNVLKLIRPRGNWIYPNIGWVFEVNKEERTITLVYGPPPNSTADHADQWDKTVATFEVFNYQVLNGLVSCNN